MSTESKNTPLAIIGIGCLFPKAAGPGFYWANVKHGVDCVTVVPPTHWDPADYFDADPKTPDMTYARRGGFLEAVDFNPMEFGIAPRDIEATDTTQLLGLVAAKQALTDAKVILESPGTAVPGLSVDRNRVSVILGVTGTLELVIPLGARLGHPKWKRAMKDAGISDDLANDAAERIAESYVPWQENSFPGLLGNVVAGRIANKLDLGGTNCVVDAACASSLSAVHLAALELQTGKADVVVTGGADTFNDIFMYMCFSKTPALSPTGDAKPFDANGDGTILGEGLGMVVLKRLADAEAVGDTIYAVIRGIGSSSDGKGNAIYAPSAAGQKKCLLNAYREAGVTPDTIELVEAHGTGTKVGDTVEVTALTDVFSSVSHEPKASVSRPWCAIGSVKSQIGHTKAAAGAASLIKATLAIYNKVLPPTAKVTKPVEPLLAADSPFYVNTKMRPWLPRAEHPRRAGLSAFGFGGSNFHAVLEEHDPQKREPDWDGGVEIVALGAASVHELLAEVQKVPVGNWAAFARFAEQSRSSFRSDAACRLCFAGQRGITDLKKLIEGAKARLQAESDATSWHTPEGAHFGQGAAPGSLAVLFPGQGSQYVGMLRELACLFPEMLESLAAANGNGRLSDRIFPPTTFDPEREKQNDLDLRDTRNAQPAIGAVSYGAWRVLHERFGLEASAFAGHSYGELTALAAAQRISPVDFFTLSHLRGELMAKRRDGDPGSMLAVIAPRADVEKAIAEQGLNLVVANHNGPKQTVISGATAEIEKAAAAFTSLRVKSMRLPVAAAFHSEFVADAAEPFRKAIEGVKFAKTAVLIYANTTATEYPATAKAAKDLLANQLAKPVEFVAQIHAMAEAGARTFLEIGPNSVLTRLAEAILDDGKLSDAEAFALDASSGKRSGVLELGQTLARLAARGIAVRLNAWEENSRCRPEETTAKPGLTVSLTGANYVSPRPKRAPRPVSDNGKHSSNPVNASKAPAMSESANTPHTDPTAIAQALAMTQQSLIALQRMQEQTTQLHRQFLEQQEAAQRTLQALVDQQQSLLRSGFSGGIPLPSLPPMQAPVALPPPPPVRVAVPPVVVPTPQARRATPPVIETPRPNSPQVQAAAKPSNARVAETLIAVVAEKTGYPATSLDLKLSLDSDLGVDSIKRVEILSTLRERLPDAPEVKPEQLGTLHTLQDVADFLCGGGSSTALDVEQDELTRTAHVTAEQLRQLANGAPSASVDIATVLLEVVAEKTGYPPSSLDLKLSLDSDLGVDSIKRVEILSALRERLPDAPEVKPEQLGTLHTLQDVADFLGGRSSSLAPQTTKLPFPIAPVRPSDSALKGPKTKQLPQIPVPTESVLRAALVSSPTTKTKLPPPQTEVMRHPVAPLGADKLDRSILQVVDLDPATPRSRVPLAPGGEVWVVGEADGLTEYVADGFAQQGLNARVMGWSGPGTNKPTAPLAGLVLVAPIQSGPEFSLNRLAFEWLQQVGPKLRQTGRQGSAVFATVARLDGMFGLGKLNADTDPSSGGLAGITKTVRHEWPELTVKAIDLAPAFDDLPAAATAVVEEILTAGPLEVGIAATHRCTLELARTLRRASSQPLGLGPKDVILVTGGARGVTAEAACALAEAFGSTLILTGRTPQPGAEPEWLAGLTAEADIKKAIADKLGPDAGPKQIGEQYHKLINQREIRRTLARIQDLGSKAAYYAVDAADGKSVADLLHQVRVKFGPITAIVHGAGVLADRRIEDLTGDDFDRVYSTKVEGLRNLLELLEHEELKAIVLFSSTTGRFGRTGQLAYAAANEVLNKTAQVESRRRPGCRVVAVNWGPWDGGMVTPGLRKTFENEGVGLIALGAGASFVVQELNAAGKAVEVIALGKHRPATSGSGLHPVPGSGITTTPAPLGGSGVVSPPNPSAAVELFPAFERVIDVESHPVLRSHVLDGKAVLPMALHLELLAHAALHGNPGLVFHGFNDFRITQGVTVEESAAVSVRTLAGKATKQDKAFLVPVELRGKRKDGREMIKSRAEIVLVSSLPKAPPADRPPHLGLAPCTVEQAYSELLFHGPDLHGLERIDGASETSFVAAVNTAPTPGEWFLYPLRSGWVADPLVLDTAFQMMILWGLAQHNTESLPNYAGRYRQFRRSFPAGPVTVVIRVTRDNGTFARADIDFLDADGQVIAQMQDYECMMEKSLHQAFRRNQLGMAKV